MQEIQDPSMSVANATGLDYKTGYSPKPLK